MTGSAVQETRERHAREDERPFRADLSTGTVATLKAQRRGEQELELKAAERADHQHQATEEHEARQQKLAQAEQAAQRQWADRRRELQAQLEAAQSALGEAQSKATFDRGAIVASAAAASEAAAAEGVVVGAERLVARAERALTEHSRGQGRKGGMFAS